MTLLVFILPVILYVVIFGINKKLRQYFVPQLMLMILPLAFLGLLFTTVVRTNSVQEEKEVINVSTPNAFSGVINETVFVRDGKTRVETVNVYAVYKNVSIWAWPLNFDDKRLKKTNFVLVLNIDEAK